MRVDVRVEGDRLVLPTGLKLKATRPTVTVDIPDEVIEMSEPERAGALLGATGSESVNRLLSDIHTILGEDYRYVPSGKSDEELLFEALQDKYCR